jgi:hypothetical protein
MSTSPAVTSTPDRAAILIASLLIVLLTAHVSQDVVYGIEEGDLSDLTAAAIAGVWLYFTVTAAGRRTGYVLLLIGAFLAPVVALAHMSRDGVRDDLPAGEGFFFVGTLMGLGAAAPFAALLSMQGLWRQRSGVAGFLLWAAIPVSLGVALLGYIIYQLN